MKTQVCLHELKTVQMIKLSKLNLKISVTLLLTISKALLVPSSIGNNWSLSFIELCILFSTQMFCGKVGIVGIGGRKFPTGTTLFRSENAMEKIMPLRNVSQLSGFVSFQFKT